MQEEALAEKTILRLLRGGDPVAFKAIYDQYWDKLYKVAAQKVPCTENAEEIIQDIFVDLWERREFLVIGDLEHYLFRAVKYKVLDYIRAQMVRRHHEDSVLRTTIEYGDPDIEEELAYRELREAFDSGLNDLPEKTKEIFRLSRVEQFSVREISKTLSVPERTVTHHIAQALRILRVCLKDYMPHVLLLFFRATLQ